MTALLTFTFILLAAATSVFSYTAFKTGGISNAIAYYKKSGTMKDWILVLVLAVAAAGLSTCAEADDKWFKYTDVYIGLEAPWSGHNKSCVPKLGPDDKIGSNLGIAQHIYSPDPAIDITTQWTHHSCAIGEDSSSYDAIGLMVRWRIQWD